MRNGNLYICNKQCTISLNRYLTRIILVICICAFNILLQFVIEKKPFSSLGARNMLSGFLSFTYLGCIRTVLVIAYTNKKIMECIWFSSSARVPPSTIIVLVASLTSWDRKCRKFLHTSIMLSLYRFSNKLL